METTTNPAPTVEHEVLTAKDNTYHCYIGGYEIHPVAYGAPLVTVGSSDTDENMIYMMCEPHARLLLTGLGAALTEVDALLAKRAAVDPAPELFIACGHCGGNVATHPADDRGVITGFGTSCPFPAAETPEPDEHECGHGGACLAPPPHPGDLG